MGILLSVSLFVSIRGLKFVRFEIALYQHSLVYLYGTIYNIYDWFIVDCVI